MQRIAIALLTIVLSGGVLADAFERGVEAYRRAAEQGDASAQYKLGLRYDNGWGVPQDDAEAVKWYRRAAEQGDASAQNNLGVMYGNGQGVPQDDVEAYAWFNLAAAQGNAKGMKNRDIAASSLTLSDRSRAQTLSREYYSRYVAPFR